MDMNLESGKSDKINEVPETHEVSQKPAEIKEQDENFDDCALDQKSEQSETNKESIEEVQDDDFRKSAGDEKSTVSETEENDHTDFDDCRKTDEADKHDSEHVNDADEGKKTDTAEKVEQNDDKPEETEIKEDDDNQVENNSVKTDEIAAQDQEIEKEDLNKNNHDLESAKAEENESIKDKEVEAVKTDEVPDKDQEAEKNNLKDNNDLESTEVQENDKDTESVNPDEIPEQKEKPEDHLDEKDDDKEIEKNQTEDLEDQNEQNEELKNAENQEIKPENEKLEDTNNKEVSEENTSYEEAKLQKYKYDDELKDAADRKAVLEIKAKEKFDETSTKEFKSEEYKKLLKEYNDITNEKQQVDDQISSIKEKQDSLNEKIAELRDAQIEKGKESANDSSYYLKSSDALQDKFNEAYYDKNAKETDLRSLQEEANVTIKDLRSSKQSIEQGMDAKFDEISEYVSSNNMNQYESMHDEHYRRLSQEYAELKQSRDRVNYSIVKLNENNRQISEKLGEEYNEKENSLKTSRISEVNHGTDDPKKTNYFIDETEAKEVLSPFKQKQWDAMTIDEQKQSIGKLADYNAEILAVENKPGIEYYNKEDSSDFGYYSGQSNAIFINEYNMKDAAETADTISHEYRHKYQHERAEKLETERDLRFKNGFNDYIQPEDDYQGYRDQLVEADARGYADKIKEKISSYTEGTDQSQRAGDQTLAAKTIEETPKNEGAFEKVIKEDFYENDEKKYVRDGLKASEVNEIKEIAAPDYMNAEEVAKYIKELNGYKEHFNYVDGHIEKVRVKSLQAIDSFENYKANHECSKYGNITDKNTVEVMALYHDTGMDGNVKADDFYKEREIYLNDPAKREAYVNKYLDKQRTKLGADFDLESEELKANKKFEAEGFESHFREQHSLESAIHVLKDRDKLVKYGVNPDEVALGCLAHSKSTSGITDLENDKQWQCAVEKVQNRVEEYNKSHPDDKINFDSSFLINKDGSMKEEKLSELRSEALVLRIGDSNGHDENSKISQNGKTIEFSLQKKVLPESYEKNIEAKSSNHEYSPFFKEVQYSEVKVGGKVLDNLNDPSGAGRMYAVGEGNFKALDCLPGDDSMIERFELRDGNAFPACTQNCILERIKECATAKPVEFTVKIDVGSDCSEETLNSYKAFKDSLKDKKEYSNIKVVLER